MTPKRILIEGRNCWRIARSNRIAFLIDGEAYFSACASAMARAGKAIYILGWDIHSRLKLVRNGVAPRLPDRLGPFLNALIGLNPDLHIYILVWDFAMIYALEREFLPVYKFGWPTAPRLHFYMDGNHPVGASHHQKIVVVDDAIAMVGGLDLSRSRWDTSGHMINDPRRVDPNGPKYDAFHDVQVAVDGEAASSLGDLARWRWLHATGEALSPPITAGNAPDPWPPHVVPNLWDTPVGIARTLSTYNGHAAVREVENLYLDAIRAADRFIYMENQYFTSPILAKALISRLREPNGPEILAILPCRNTGWLEENTMGVLRERILRQLREADTYGRFRAYCPYWKTAPSHLINVHSKVFIVDDEFLRIGSSNLSNRSLGLDSECDVAMESAGRQDIRDAISAFRNRLMGEHLGVSPERVRVEVMAAQSVVTATDALLGGDRTLRRVEDLAPPWLDTLIPDATYIDPERPVDPDELMARLAPEEVQQSGKDRIFRASLILLFLIAAALVWRLTPLKELLNPALVSDWLLTVKGSMAGPFITLGIYVVGGIVMFPVTVLILATALTFEPVHGFLYSMMGALLSASASYGIGRLMGRNMIRRITGPKLNSISRKLARRGVMTMAILRIFPVAPFSMVNMVAGASHIRFRDFAIGTALGMAPGMFMVTIIGDKLHGIIKSPSLENLAVLASIVLLLVTMIVWSRRWIARREPDAAESASSD